jgi:hypothetical protein
MASSTLSPSRRRQEPRHQHHLAESVSDELHHLLEIEEKGESPLAALLVVLQVMLVVLVIVAVETTVAMAFYFGWL